METWWSRGKDILQAITQYKMPLLLGAISLSTLSTGLIYYLQSASKSSPIEIVTGETLATISGQMRVITVDIGGGVVHPGVYQIPEGSRLVDAIERAGGFSGKANQDLIEKGMNRASRLIDGAKIYVPMKQAKQTSHNDDTSHNNEPEIIGNEPISINSASVDALETLPGVGPVTATKIIELRPYLNLNELVSKQAVGNKLFERIKEKITL